MWFNIQFLVVKLSRRNKEHVWQRISHRKLLLIRTFLILSVLITPTFAQQIVVKEITELPLPKSVYLSEQDVSDTINCFRTDDVKKAVEVFKSKMPSAIANPKFRVEVMQKLPSIVKQLRIDNAEINASFSKIIAPVLELYGKDKVYEIVIFKHPTPLMFSDSGVLLAVSTGMIERARSDDELRGFVAHEIGHEYYAKASVYTKHILGFVTEDKGDQALARKYWESLSLIELQCDSFAALTLAYLDNDPLAFIEGLERVDRDFSKLIGGFHPQTVIRRKVVEAVVSSQNPAANQTMSGELRKLKELVVANNGNLNLNK